MVVLRSYRSPMFRKCCDEEMIDNVETFQEAMKARGSIVPQLLMATHLALVISPLVLLEPRDLGSISVSLTHLLPVCIFTQVHGVQSQ